MQNRRTKWLVLLAISIMLSILRLIDFADEAINEGFHMTRAGLDLMGTNALVLQLIILFISLLFVWVATSKLYVTSRAVLLAPIASTTLVSTNSYRNQVIA
jgi:hypothetical protein